MTNDQSIDALSVFTIGHSNHETEAFVELLKQHAVEVVVDTRSSPYSRYAPQFNREPLKRILTDANVQYVYLGEELGGRPSSSEYYDEDGHVLYSRVAASETFKQGINRLVSGIQRYRVAILCSEEDPIHCHRRLLISRVLCERNIQVTHIRGDGSVQSEQSLRAETGDDPAAPKQRGLFGQEERDEWRSTQSVLHRRRLPNSSES